MKFISYIYVLFLGLILSSCSDNDNNYIPPALDDPKNQETDEVYNDPDFTPHKDGEPYDSYRGLVMAGYQGWFGTPGDDCSHGDQWYHYQERGMFEPGVLRNSIDFWPDVSEYEKKYDTNNFYYPNGQKAQVYSSYDKSSILLHFKWMKDYGIDGVFMQRFVSEVIDNPKGKDHFDKVLKSAMEGSNTYQRAICIMYDLSGSRPEQYQKVLDDAKTIMDNYQLLDRNAKQKFYLYENGKPLIVLWGVGFNDNRPYSLTDVEQLMNGLKEKGFSIMLGVPTYWRDLNGDTMNDTKLHELVKKADVIMPWFVGRYNKDSYPEKHDLIVKDIKWCKENDVEYAPLCFPGYADRNMHPNNTISPRYGGQFLWDQAYHCIKSGAQMLYIAMFDEIDEGTAIFKCLNKKDVPDNIPSEDYYVLFKDNKYSVVNEKVEGLTGNNWCESAKELNVEFQGVEDEYSTDQYLWITGQAAKMLRGEIPLKSQMPNR